VLADVIGGIVGPVCFWAVVTAACIHFRCCGCARNHGIHSAARTAVGTPTKETTVIMNPTMQTLTGAAAPAVRRRCVQVRRCAVSGGGGVSSGVPVGVRLLWQRLCLAVVSQPV
jgi:hypothetical protein